MFFTKGSFGLKYKYVNKSQSKKIKIVKQKIKEISSLEKWKNQLECNEKQIK